MRTLQWISWLLFAAFSANCRADAWVADDLAVYKLDPAAARISATVALPSARALAVDPRDGALWVLSDKDLARRSAAGAVTFVASLDSLLLAGASRLALDPRDGTAWIGEGKDATGAGRFVRRVDANGAVVASLPSPVVVSGLAVALDRTLWVLGARKLLHYSPQGAQLAEIDLSALVSGEPKLLTVDSLGAWVWVAAEGRLVRIDADTPAAARLTLSVDKSVDAFTVDEARGRLWVLAGKMLLGYEASATPATSVDLDAIEVKNANTLAFDPFMRALLVGYDNGVARLDENGANAQRIATPHKVAAIGVAPGTLDTTMSLVSPLPGALLNNALAPIVLRIAATCSGVPCAPGADFYPGYRLVVDLNGVAIGERFTIDGATGLATYVPTAPYAEGAQALRAQATDPFGGLSNELPATFTIDTQPPAFTALQPSGTALTNRSPLRISGRLNEPATLRIDGIVVAVAADGTFFHDRALVEGMNTIVLEATDAAGNVASRTLSARLDSVAPPAVAAPTVTIAASPTAGAFTVTGSAGAAEANATVIVTNVRTGETAQATAAASGAFSVVLAGRAGDSLVIKVVDAAGNESAPTALSIPGNQVPLPPDPATVAPPLDPSVPGQLARGTAFLYTGPNPIQTGVAPGTIEARRAAVIRGKVLDRSGVPLPAVRVSVLKHPELGQTLSRADGEYDLAVNGGGLLTLVFDREGALPAQLQVKAPWQDFVVAPDVAMVSLDTRVTTVQMGASTLQVARGNPVADQDGPRQATLLFKPGTTATMRLADGSTQPVASINVRATEYTVGPNGQKAMPGPLPPTSGYTYAVELSADEAIAAGAKQVTFSQPVPLYVDNFLGFPVGGHVPAGYYDRDLAAWVPADNGRIVRVLAIANGLALLDVKGDGSTADAAALSALGITDAERGQLAQLYAPGKTLWRVPIPHFTPWDCNWPYGPPLDALGPDGTDDDGKETDVEQEKECEPCEQGGSVIEAENQVLGEKIAIAGTPFTLNYRSDRVPGYGANRTIRIPVSNSRLPASVKRIEMTVDVAGRQFSQTFAPTPRQTYRFKWDGMDRYGRGVAGATPATVNIRYLYEFVYQQPANFARSFARLSGVPMEATRGRLDFALRYTRTVVLNRRGPAQGASPAAAQQGLGGWTLDVNHAHGGEAGGVSLSLGDGTSREVQGNFMSAAASGVLSVGGLGVDPAGNVFASGYYGFGVRKIGVDANVSQFKPSGNQIGAFGADGLGNMYGAYAFFNQRAIYRMGPDGSDTPVAGSLFNSSGPGIGPALQAVIRPEELAVARDGTVYFTEQVGIQNNVFVSRCWVKKVTPDGMISVVAGNGTCATAGDGGPAEQATFARPGAVALDSQGNLYVSDSTLVRRIGTDGVVRTIAGNPQPGFECLPPLSTADGTLAANTCLGTVRALAVDLSDRLLIASDDQFDPSFRQMTRVRRIAANGTVETVAGPGTPSCNQGSGIPPDQVGPAQAVCPAAIFSALTVNSNGDVLAGMGSRVAIVGTRETRWAGLLGQSLGEGEQRVASRDGTRAYIFDVIGKHVRTVDTRTNAVVYRFSHDAGGRLVAIEDAHGNTTTIARDPSGTPTAIVGPYGHRTVLGVDANGYLSAIANPNGETHRPTHRSDGLLTRLESPKGAASTFEYDDLGRLKRDANAASGFWQLDRTEGAANGMFEVAMTSAEGRTTRHRVETLADKSKRRTVVSADGTQASTVTAENGTTTVTAPDGTVVTRTDGPDARFGMQAPRTASDVMRLPSGLTRSTASSQVATLADPANPMSLVRQTTTTTVNGRAFASLFEAATRKFTATSAEGRVSGITVDALGRPALVETAGLQPMSYGYDARGRLESIIHGTGADKRAWSLAYGTDGAVRTITDALTQSVVYQRDAASRVTQATMPGNRVVGVGHDANGNITSLTPPGRPAHAFHFNAVDLRDEEEPPRAGMPASKTEFRYNRDRQLTAVLRPDGTSITIAHDAAGRRRTLTPSPGAGGVITYGYSTTGALDSIQAPGIAIGYGFDGRLPTRETYAGVVNGTLLGTYDENFRVTGISVNGVNTTLAYDRDDLVTRVGSLTFTRRPENGLVSGSTLGGFTTTRGYSPFGQLESMTARHGATALYAFTLTRDPLDRVIGRVAMLGGVTTTYGYGYDLAGRLDKVTRDGATVRTFGYDANGNRTQVDGATVATYDDQDRLQSYAGATYEFTAAGTLRRKTVGSATTAYAYDVFGNLQQATLPDGTVIAYVADGRNRRVAKKVNGVLVQGFLYQDKIRIAAELDGSGAVVSRFHYATAANAPEYFTKGGVDYRVVTDQVGSVRLVVNTQTGAIAQRIDYDEFGNVLLDTNPGFQPFGFAGGLYDRDTGLVRFGARDYDPETGRWTARDPVGFRGGDTNLYAYVGSSPLTFSDPLGLQMWWNGKDSWTDVPDSPDWMPYEPGKPQPPEPASDKGGADRKPQTDCPPATTPSDPAPPSDKGFEPTMKLEYYLKLNKVCFGMCLYKTGLEALATHALLNLMPGGTVHTILEVGHAAHAGVEGLACYANCQATDSRWVPK